VVLVARVTDWGVSVNWKAVLCRYAKKIAVRHLGDCRRKLGVCIGIQSVYVEVGGGCSPALGVGQGIGELLMGDFREFGSGTQA